MSAGSPRTAPEVPLSTASAVAPVEATPEIAPTHFESVARFDQEALDAAREIQDVKRGDTLGAATRLHRNLGRNSLIVSNTVAVAYATTVNGVMINAIPTGVVYETVGTVLAGAIYAGGKWREGRKINKAERPQARIREELGEPVDVFKVGPRKQRTTVLRWYGYDASFTPGTSDGNEADSNNKHSSSTNTSQSPTKTELPSLSGVVKSFETAVAFAKESGIKEIAASARLLDGIPKEDRQKFGKIVENDTLTRQKRVQVTDLAADKEIVRCDIKEAEALIAEIKETTQTHALLAVVSLLEEARPGHPFIGHAKKLAKHGYDEATVRQAKTVLRTKLEQTSGNGTTLIKQTGRDGEMTIDREYTYARLNGADMDLVGVMHSRDSANQDARYKGRESLLKSLGFETVDELIKDTQERRHVLAPNVVQQRAEVAGWLVLRDPTTASHNAQPIPIGNSSTEAPTTLLQRLPSERQRSTAMVLRRRGKVPKDEQTIEYTPARPPHRFSRVKRGAGTVALLAATSGAALGIGELTNDGLNSLGGYLQQEYALDQGYKDGRLPYDREKDFKRHLENSPSIAAKLDQAFNSVAKFDSALSDAMAPYVLPLMPPGLTEDLLPYADPDWLYEKQAALENLNNAYTDGRDKSRVGDVSTDKNGVAWKLTPNGGANTEGYWPQSVQSHINTQDGITGANWTPPYRLFGIQYETDTEEYRWQAAYDSSYARFVPLKNPDQIGTEETYIKVEGQKLLDDANMSSVAVPLEEEGYGYSDLVYGYALPVQLGADVIAATAERYTVKDNLPLGKQELKVIQIPNGAFYLIPIDPELGSVYDNDLTYLNITYWIDPNATTERPLRADMPLTLPTEGSIEHRPLEEGLSERQALQVWRTLSGNPNASELPSAEDAAAMISSEKGYSFTPYQDNGVKLTQDEPASVGEGLSTVGTVAAELPDLNCNQTATTEIIASRGRTETGGFVNPSTGYNNDSDNILKTGEAHMVLVTNGTKDNIIDGTPAGGDLTESEDESEGYDPNMSPANEVLSTARTGAETLAALALATYGFRMGRRYVPKTIEMTNDYLNTRATGKLFPGGLKTEAEPTSNITESGFYQSVFSSEPKTPPTPEEEAEKQRVETEKQKLHDLVSILQWMQHAPEGSQLDQNALPRYFASSHGSDLAARYNGLPPTLSAKQVRARVRLLEAEDRLQLSDETKTALTSFVRNHTRHQAYRRARTEQAK